MRRTLLLPAVVPLLALHSAAPVSSQITDRDELVAALDSTARAHAADSTVAGVAVAVVQGSDTLLLDGFGYADLEFDVPTPPDAVYEIGSITKQFTAAAVLQLVEAGSIDLDADVTEYLPEFDTRGHRVSVRRLLNHTSGIRSYTEMPFFRTEIEPRDLPRDTLVSLIEAEPFDFEPGTALIYNNSAYFLLGLIIEEVSGQSYQDYVNEQLFRPAGMEDSYYCDERATVRHRAHGYAWSGPERGLLRKQHLYHTWPFSGGSLCSTVGDLVAWTRALHGGRILGEAAHQEMITPDTLLDGTRLRYGMGLGVHQAGGHRTIDHGGTIYGFFSYARYYPEVDLIIIALQNTEGPNNPELLTGKLAELVLGPREETDPPPFAGDLEELKGRYSGRARPGMITFRVESDSTGLLVKREGTEAEPSRLKYRGGLTWTGNRGRRHYTFLSAGDRIAELRLDGVFSHLVLRRVPGS